MRKCDSCGNEIPVSSTVCTFCGSPTHWSDTGASHNPYQVSGAVMDAAPAATHSSEDGEFEYRVPFGVGPIIGSIFGVWSESLPKLMLAALVPFLPMTVLGIIAVVIVAIFITSLGSVFTDFDFDRIASIDTGITLVVTIVMFIVAFMAVGIPAFIAQMRIIDEKVRTGEHRLGAWETYWSSFRYVPPVLGMIFLIYLALIVVAIPAAFMVTVPVVMGVYIFLVAIVFTVATIRLCVAVPCMVFEKRSIFSALAESSRLVRGHVWAVMGIAGVMFMVMVGIGIVVGGMSLIPILGQLANLGANLALSPLQAAAIWAIYAGLKTPRASF
jgi:hypothetical protein